MLTTTCEKDVVTSSGNIKERLEASRTISNTDLWHLIGEQTVFNIVFNKRLFHYKPVRFARLTLHIEQMDGKEVIYVLIEAICGPQVASKLIHSGYDHMQDLIFMDKVQLGEILAKEEERAQLEKALREGNNL